MALWLVRAGKDGEFEAANMAAGVCSIGWREIELEGVGCREDVAARIAAAFPGAPRGRRSNWTGQVWAFVGRIAVGDLVVMPLKRTGMVAVGEVTGPYAFAPGMPDGAQHTRPVRWLTDELPRAALGRDLPPASGTIEQVLDWARERFPEVVWELAEAAVEVVRRVVTQVARLAQDWPEAVRRLRRVRVAELPAGTLAVSRPDGTTQLARAVMGEPSRLVEALAEEGEWLGAPWELLGYESLVIHELAHHLHWAALEDERLAGPVARWMATHPTALEIDERADTPEEAFAFALEAALLGQGTKPAAALELLALLRALR